MKYIYLVIALVLNTIGWCLVRCTGEEVKPLRELWKEVYEDFA